MTLFLIGQILCVAGGCMCMAALVKACRRDRLIEAGLLVLWMFFFVGVMLVSAYRFGGFR